MAIAHDTTPLSDSVTMEMTVMMLCYDDRACSLYLLGLLI